mgnify:CR=1 FL=1
MGEVLSRLPRSLHPDLLVGFEFSDDAGVFRLPDGKALVQTMDFFTPVVDDPYAYGQIAAANALSDVYAMGGEPITAMNIACFDPDAAPAEVWSDILRGMADNTIEAGAVTIGGHSVKDDEPKFGMSVTGILDPDQMFVNSAARVGDSIWLTKPLGTGIITTAAKRDDCPEESLQAAIATMRALNRDARDAGLAAGVACATDITGFWLLGHLANVARASGVRILLRASSLPLLPHVQELAASGHTTGGGSANLQHLAPLLRIDSAVTATQIDLMADPQTSGGLALFAPAPIGEYPCIGVVIPGPPGLEVAH